MTMPQHEHHQVSPYVSLAAHFMATLTLTIHLHAMTAWVIRAWWVHVLLAPVFFLMAAVMTIYLFSPSINIMIQAVTHLRRHRRAIHDSEPQRKQETLECPYKSKTD